MSTRRSEGATQQSQMPFLMSDLQVRDHEGGGKNGLE